MRATFSEQQLRDQKRGKEFILKISEEQEIRL